MEFFTRKEALRYIEETFGFPNPSSKYILWYFNEYGGGYILGVNSDALAVEIKEKKLVQKLGEVRCFKRDDERWESVLEEIRLVIEKHRL